MLFEPFQLGKLTLQNRVVMAPMTRSRATDNLPNVMMAKYYGQRGSAGLIITEGTAPSPNALGYPRIPGAFSAAQTDAWRAVTEAAHRDGAKIFLQIMHTGRVSHPDNMPAGGRVLAPSAVALTDTKMYVDGKGEQDIPLATPMTEADIQTAIDEYVQTAKNAIEAGFDGVELHAANGYLLEQFLHPGTNKRTDRYGGSLENRLRFVRNVAEATVAAIGADRTGIRVSPYGAFNEMGEFDGVDETHVALAKLCKEIGLVYLHIVDHEAMGAPAVPTEIKRKLQFAFEGPIILSGGYDAERANRDLRDGKGDLVAFGRPFISNPDLVLRMREGEELTDPNQETFYTPGVEGYIDYPVLAES